MNELTKNLVCLITMDKSELWVEEDKLKTIKSIIENNGNSFIEINGEFVRASQIVKIHTAEYMAEKTRKKNGEWKCKYGTWHKRFEKCDCGRQTETILPKIEKSNNDHESNMETMREAMSKNKNCA